MNVGPFPGPWIQTPTLPLLVVKFGAEQFTSLDFDVCTCKTGVVMLVMVDANVLLEQQSIPLWM